MGVYVYDGSLLGYAELLLLEFLCFFLCFLFLVEGVLGVNNERIIGLVEYAGGGFLRLWRH